MNNQPRSWPGWTGLAEFAVGLLAGGLGAAAILLAAISISQGDVLGAMAGALLLAVAGAAGVLGAAFVELVRLGLDQAVRAERLASLTEQLARQSDQQQRNLTYLGDLLRSIEKWSRLSADGRAVLGWSHERAAFREAINAAMSAEQWAEADRIIDALERRFDAADEAKLLRLRARQLRDESLRRQADRHVERIRELTAADQFIEADRQLVTFRQLFPADPRVPDLSLSIRTARRKRRDELSNQWQQASQAQDVARLRDLLSRFERIVSDEELANLRLQLTAIERQVQLALRDRFAELVKAKRWSAALKVADEVLARYPQAAMAADIRRIYQQLVERARSDSAEALSFPQQRDGEQSPR